MGRERSGPHGPRPISCERVRDKEGSKSGGRGSSWEDHGAERL